MHAYRYIPIHIYLLTPVSHTQGTLIAAQVLIYTYIHIHACIHIHTYIHTCVPPAENTYSRSGFYLHAFP